jgi:ribosomal protein S18 acetylase RimI-like enzyme
MPDSAQLADGRCAAGISLQAYRPALLQPLVDFWNSEFANRRNFFPITPELFRQRVVGKNYPEEPFDPAGLILALDAADGKQAVVGMVHCGLRSEGFCRAVYPDQPMGGEAYVALIAVARRQRRKGLGKALWDAATAYVASKSEAVRLILDSQCLNLFYGNSDGLYAPLWGSTEGIGIAWEDYATRKFLSKRGYEPQSKAMSLELPLATFRPFSSGAEKSLAERGLQIQWIDGRRPRLGGPPSDTLVSGQGAACGSVCCLHQGRVVAVISSYPMVELQRDKAAIYDFETMQEYRGLGIGKAILWEMLIQLRNRGAVTCEVLTIPQLSPHAHVLYRQAGFRPVAEWAVY